MPTSQRQPTVHFHFLKKDFKLTGRIALRRFIERLFKKEGISLQELHYIFCSDPYLLEINQKHLGHNTYTDIISFDLSEHKGKVTGEIYISTDRVKENAIRFGVSFREELLRVLFHGALHLCGYKDKKAADIREMRKMEDRYLALFRKNP